MYPTPLQATGHDECTWDVFAATSLNQTVSTFAWAIISGAASNAIQIAEYIEAHGTTVRNRRLGILSIGIVNNVDYSNEAAHENEPRLAVPSVVTAMI